VALSFPDDFPFNRRPTGPEAPMTPQEKPQVQQDAPRVRPAVPPGARAAAAAMTVPPAPVPAAVPGSAPATAAVERNAPNAAVSPRAHERRRSPRQTLVAKAVVRSEFNQNTVATGFLSNISMLGVGFHTRRPLAVGEKFQMRLELGPMKWATRLRVVSCQPHDSGTYDVGAEFIGSDLVDRVQRELAA
jgi:hypothetical protein